ncbi:DUF11 domain-containing protein [Candidatus Saccharibacteria bacterium]|nr:DUF11 domain-containing protein [Candidatus Saccharibacteria bacterium]
MKNLKTVLGVAAVAALAGTTFVATNVSAWGDSDGGRTNYTIEQINNGAIDDKIVLNSIADNPDLNELYFVQARAADAKNVWNAEDIEVANGKEYVVRLYVHNNNPRGTEMVAKDVFANVNVPTESGKSITVTGTVSASNATPSKVWDEVVFKSSTNTFHLEYVKGSALIENKGKVSGTTLSDNLVMGGTTIGYDALNGEIPGCFGYASIVTFRVKAVYDYDFSVSKLVRLAGETEWKKQVYAKPGDTVEYKITYKNTSDSREEDVVIFDKLGSNQTYIAGSTKLYNSNYKEGLALKSDGLTTTEGINIGAYDPGAAAVVTFSVKMKDDNLGCGGDNVLRSWAQGYIGHDANMKQDYADVLIYKACPKNEEPVDPVTPDTPTVIPSTGPADIAMTALGAGSVVTAAGYYWTSRKRF